LGHNRGLGAPLVADTEGVRWITFDRPEVLNALTLEDLDFAREVVAELHDEVRAIVFTGSGERAFSAGMHLETFTSAHPGEGRELIERVGAFVGAVRRAPVPTVAMVNGYCLGAAFELALACDVRVAHPDVRFGLPEVKLGIPSVVEAALLRHHVGLSKATELILTGDLYAPNELPDGLSNRLVPREDLRPTTDELVEALTANTREVIAAQKELLAMWLETGLDEGVEVSKDVFGRVFALPATREAIARYRSER
jgi:enoyl-CoA hydratase/carnithine racemase